MLAKPATFSVCIYLLTVTNINSILSLKTDTSLADFLAPIYYYKKEAVCDLILVFDM